MANLRDIINAAAPGLWWEGDETRIDTDVPEDIAHIAAYSPDHALLIEEFIEAHAEFVRAHASLDAFHRYSVALDNLNHYRRERGLDG